MCVSHVSTVPFFIAPALSNCFQPRLYGTKWFPVEGAFHTSYAFLQHSASAVHNKITKSTTGRRESNCMLFSIGTAAERNCLAKVPHSGPTQRDTVYLVRVSMGRYSGSCVCLLCSQLCDSSESLMSQTRSSIWLQILVTLWLKVRLLSGSVRPHNRWLMKGLRL